VLFGLYIRRYVNTAVAVAAAPYLLFLRLLCLSRVRLASNSKQVQASTLWRLHWLRIGCINLLEQFAHVLIHSLHFSKSSVGSRVRKAMFDLFGCANVHENMDFPTISEITLDGAPIARSRYDRICSAYKSSCCCDRRIVLRPSVKPCVPDCGRVLAKAGGPRQLDESKVAHRACADYIFLV
jgi:hypothetical protein